MKLIVEKKEKGKIIGGSLLLTLFSIFPFVYMMNESYEFFIKFISLTVPPLIIVNVIAFLSNKASFSFFSLIINFSYFAFSSISGFYLASKLYFGIDFFIIFFIVYMLFFLNDNYILYKNGYFFKYKKIFYENILNDRYLFNNVREFEELKDYRVGTKIPKIQILYLLAMPFFYIFKGAIFKVSSQDSNISSGLGTALILSFVFIYVFGAMMILIQDFIIRLYFSINYKN